MIGRSTGRAIGIEVDARTGGLRRWFATLAQDPRSEQWAIDLPEAGYVGDLDLHGINPVAREAWVIPFLGDPQARRPEVLAGTRSGPWPGMPGRRRGWSRLMVEVLNRPRRRSRSCGTWA